MTIPPAARPARDAGGVDAPRTDLATEAAGGFDCPRCHEPADGRFYGPCTSCRDELRRTLGGVARDVARGSFEPSMHVTPNAVALKDD